MKIKKRKLKQKELKKIKKGNKKDALKKSDFTSEEIADFEKRFGKTKENELIIGTQRHTITKVERDEEGVVIKRTQETELVETVL